MNAKRYVAFCVCLAAVLVMSCAAIAQIPQKMNYQAMLTDDADQPLAEQTVTMVFTIYDAESGGTALWTETQSPTTNSIGVVSVLLGDVAPIDFDLSGPVWLEVEVNGETLSPRRELVTAPYAAWAASADNAAMLGGTEPHEYVLADDLDGPGTVNDPSNPVDWNVLFGVPSGFADGVDDTGGAGDGHSLDADDGSPVDALYVESDGTVRVGTQGQSRSLCVGGTSQFNSSVSLTDGPFGGEMALRDPAGVLVGWLKTDESTGGGGRFELARNDEGMLGFKVDGNYSSTEEPQVKIVGSSRQVLFDMRNEGTHSVSLPDDAIDRDEMRDEPGVGSIQAAGELDINPGNITTVASRTIVCPTSGYVYVHGTAELTMYLYDSSGVEVKSGISTSINAWSGAAQENLIDLPGILPGAWYHMQASAQGLFQVSAGNNTFHMNIQEINGDVRVSGRQLSVMFFPTAYGTVDVTD